MRSHLASLCAFLLFFAASCRADPTAEATQLKDEALAILKANTDKQAEPEEYATCLLKLEKAQALLDTAGDSASMLAREVSSALFWARRFSNVQVLAALDTLKGVKGGSVPAPRKVASAPPAKPAANPPGVAQPPETPEIVRMREGAASFASAATYAVAHTTDDYVVALGWFEMASLNPGSDYALKAIEQARRAWRRFSKQQAEELPDTPEMEPVKQADELAVRERYEPAFALYQVSLKKKETAVAHKHLGKAYYERAQQLAEQIKPKFDAHFATYNGVWQGAWRVGRLGKVFDPNDAGLRNWNAQFDQLRKEADVAQKLYQSAEQGFRAALKLSPEQKDFDSAGYVGLCMTVRPFFRNTGQRVLEDFIKNYTPVNDDQRLLYEFSKAEIDRIRRGK